MSQPEASTARELLQAARETLAANPHAEPRDARLLLAHALGRSEASVLALGHEPLDPEAVEAFRALVDRRAAGEPFAYLVGEREFYGRAFHVDPRVLIPRPETEHLVEAILDAVAPDDANACLVDVGVGSGCIALTAALERPRLRVIGVDVSLDALAVAKINRARFGLEGRVQLVATDLAAALDLRSCTVLASNPPYVAHDAELAPEVRDHEPATALFPRSGDPSTPATHMYQALFELAPRLPDGARIAVEVGFDQAEEVRRMAGERVRHVGTRSDLAGIERVVELQIG